MFILLFDKDKLTNIIWIWSLYKSNFEYEDLKGRNEGETKKIKIAKEPNHILRVFIVNNKVVAHNHHTQQLTTFIL